MLVTIRVEINQEGGGSRMSQKKQAKGKKATGPVVTGGKKAKAKKKGKK